MWQSSIRPHGLTSTVPLRQRKCAAAFFLFANRTAAPTMSFVEGAAAIVLETGFFGFLASRFPCFFSVPMTASFRNAASSHAAPSACPDMAAIVARSRDDNGRQRPAPVCGKNGPMPLANSHPAPVQPEGARASRPRSSLFSPPAGGPLEFANSIDRFRFLKSCQVSCSEKERFSYKLLEAESRRRGLGIGERRRASTWASRDAPDPTYSL